ncbi:MAG: hypothetical protein LUQ65_15185 [Candidatus Helarchaeota archaeon]|nr:hypothetical protein [Candidatus Helarchaeota archaeon]
MLGPGPVRLSIVQDKSNNQPSPPPPSSRSGKVDESLFYIGPDELNAKGKGRLLKKKES